MIKWKTKQIWKNREKTKQNKYEKNREKNKTKQQILQD
jgi:hypothetical protein